MSDGANAFTLAYYAGDRKTGTIHVVRRQDGQITSSLIAPAAESGKDKALKPVMLGVSPQGQAILMDPASKAIEASDRFPADAFAAHLYADPAGRAWYMNDGDKETGNDTLNCGDRGSSVMVVENPNSGEARHLATVCVGRGHHQADFSFPSSTAPHVPRQAYVSNLKDGTLTVIGNEPGSEDWLKVVATINLCEADKEDGREDALPNNSFPHGLAYSPVSGKIYNLNNGYGTVAVIDPVSHQIEQRVSFKGHSNLFASPCGNYLIGRGADRKSDPEHVLAKLSVMDAVSLEVKASITLPDIYISKYFLNPEGTRLYLTTSSSGNETQAANLKTDALLVFDLTALPELKPVAEHRLGAATGTMEFVGDGKQTKEILLSTAARGSLIRLDGQSDEVLDEISLFDPQPHSRIWLIWQDKK